MKPLTDERLTEIYENKNNFYREEVRSMANELLELRSHQAVMVKFIQQTRNWVSDMGHQPMTDACNDILMEVRNDK